MKRLLLIFTVLTTPAFAGHTVISEYQQLYVLAKTTPDIYQLVMDLNMRLANKCSATLYLDKIDAKLDDTNSTVFKLLAIRRLKGSHSKDYLTALSQVPCPLVNF